MISVTTGDMMHVYGGFAENVDYTVRLTVRLADEADPLLLAEAAAKAQKRYPYLSLRLKKGREAFYYEPNFLPVMVHKGDARTALGCAEANFHLWSVSCSGDRIHLDIYHGAADGTGMYALLATLLYYYCEKRYGLNESSGVRTLEAPILPGEYADPQDALPEPAAAAANTPALPPAFDLVKDGGLTPSPPTVWDIAIPEDAFIRFTSANDSSPGTMVSLLTARAIDLLFPGHCKETVGAYVINARPMLGAPLTHHNCLSMALFPHSERLKKLPFPLQCTVYRGMTFIQSESERVLDTIGAAASAVRHAARSAETLDEKKAAFGPMFRGGEGVMTYLVSYTGRWRHEALGKYLRELWAHPPNTFDLMTEIGAAGGMIFISMQQRFCEDSVRRAFLAQLEENGIPYEIVRKLRSDNAHFPEPDRYD